MPKSVLDQDHFKDEAAAYAWVEARVWPDGRICPHCGVVDRSGPLKGKSTRHGVYKCYVKECRKPFTVKVGTIFEASHIELHIWLQAMFLLASSKKGISSHQLARTLGVTVKSAWFMSHRIREAMREGPFAAPFGGGGTDVAVDETFYGRDPEAAASREGKPSAPWIESMKVLTLIDHESGRARSFVVDDLSAATLVPILSKNISKEARLLTDEAPRYKGHGKRFRAHGSVNHGKDEYVSAEDPTIHINRVEGFYSIFKRGMRGVYQHASKRHLHRYAAEFDFRYSNRIALGIDDQARFATMVEGAWGRRLTYTATNRKEAEA